MASANDIHLPDDWRDAVEHIVGEGRRRVAILGATDTGKSSFALVLLGRLPGAALIDLDPGQKMVGPPGTVSLGRNGVLERFVFLGTTGSAGIRAIGDGARLLAAAHTYVANTSGMVLGLGVPLQVATISALRPDTIVAIGEGLNPILAAHGGTQSIRLQPSPAARRKTPSARAAIRQAAFAGALAGGVSQMFERKSVALEPGAPAPFVGPNRPVCALAGSRDLAVGVLESVGEDGIRVLAPPVSEPVRSIRLGRMWAAPEAAGWRLLTRLSPAWI